jgi:hypothetical protein
MFLAVIAFSVPSVLADVPELLSYQGVLTDASGVVVPDGPYNVAFRLYTGESGGSPIWEEAHVLTVSKGIFNARLGWTQPLGTLDFDLPYYLGISVEGGAELEPRALLTDAAYAMNARMVKGSEAAGNKLPALGSVGIGTTSPDHTLTVRGNEQTPLYVNGNNAGWASIYVHALQPGARPGYGYVRGTLLKAHTYVDPSDRWQLSMGGVERVCVAPSGDVGIGVNPPLEKLHVEGGLRIGNTSTSAAGALRWTGTDFEGYDGSTWKSLTATGGGSLPSGTIGQTLRHNGASWAAASNLFNDGMNIGIGTTAPAAPFDVAGGRWDLDATEGDLKVGDGTFRLKIGVAIDGLGAGISRIRSAGGQGRLILGGDAADVLSVDGAGNTMIGGPTSNAKLKLFHSGIDSALVRAYTSTYGGHIHIYDANGAMANNARPSFYGEGGWYGIARNAAGYAGFLADCNYNGTTQPRVTIEGSTRGAYFRMDQADNASVVLPANAISAAEILDEPGVASYADGSTSVACDAGLYTTIGARSITVAASGYVLAIGTSSLMAYHTTGTDSETNIGISTSNSALPANQNVYVEFSSALPSDTYFHSLTVHGLFEVTAGTHTFYFLVHTGAGSPRFHALKRQLSLVFIPTSYGTVQPTAASFGVPSDADARLVAFTDADLAAEREASIAQNNARLERELAAMRAELEAVKAMVQEK